MEISKGIEGLFCRVAKAFIVTVILVTSPALQAGSDPYESLNRNIFAFNEFVDKWLLKPVAKGYRAITPGFVDDGVSNMFDNLSEVGNLLNAGLQGDFRHMSIATGRLLINSTIGLGGLIDVASDNGLPQREEDFGQTLGVWGLESGPYIVLPFLGSSSLRDAPARLVDWYTSPIAYLDDTAVANSLRLLDIVDARADLFDAEALISGDRYSFIREVYLQQRQFSVNNGQLEDDFDAFEDDDF